MSAPPRRGHDFSRSRRESLRRLRETADALAERTRALELAEALLGVAFEACEDALLVVDARERVVHASRRFLELWRVPEEVAASRSFDDLRRWCATLVDDADRAEARPWPAGERAVELVDDGDAGDAGDDTFALRDGRVLSRRLRRAPLGAAGVGRVVSFRDVTAEGRRERELRASEQRFRAIFDQAAVGVAEIDTTTGRFVQINKKYEEIIGYSAAEMPTLDFMRITYPEDLAPDLARMELLKRGELREFTLEKRLLRKDGTPIWVNLNVSPLWAPGEAPTHHVAVVQDISERRRAESHLAGVVEFAPDGVLMVNEAGRVVLANRVAEDLFGYTRDELLHLEVEDLIPHGARGAHVAMRRSFQREGTVRRMDAPRSRVWALRKDGAKIPVEISLSPIDFEDGRLVVASVRDVTERARAEHERAALEHQLRQAQKMDALGSLAGGIAHDFNNLLTAIVISAELLRTSERDSAASLERIDAIRAASTRGKDLVRQILAFSRKQPLQRSFTAIDGILDEAASLLRASIPSGVRITTEVAPNAPGVLADRAQLHQVLVNLGTNAWHAIARGTGQITFRLDAVDVVEGSPAPGRLAPGRYARIQVEDDGIGMEPAVAARVFEPFFTTKPVNEGTGLGLAIVHRIVTDHGGVIELDSAPGRGTTFSILLPEAEDTRPPLEAARAPAVVECSGHVLFVDDDLLVLRAASRSLESLGFRVTSFARASEALDAVRADSSAFDVVVTDHNMPEMSGLALAAAIGRIRIDLPVVLVSGNLSSTVAELATANVRQLVQKPFTGSELSEVLAGVMKARS